MTWRDVAKPIIADVIQTVGTDDMKKLRAALREAYPFFERENHPYKIWCDEIHRQLGTRKSKNKKSSDSDAQISLFSV